MVHFIQVASQGAEIKKLGNIGKVSKKGGAKPTTSLTFTNKTFVLVVKTDAKTDIKFFSSCQILLDFLTLLHKLRLQLSK